MRKLYLTLTALIAAFSIARSQDAQKAEDHFRNSSIISFNTNTKPEQLVGALIFYKPGKKDEFQYFTILDEEQKSRFEPMYNNKIIYQTMANKELVASVKYLALFTASVKDNYRLEVVLEDVLDYKVPGFATDPEIMKKVFLYTSTLKKQGYIVEYVDNVNLCTLTTRMFQEQKEEGSGTYFIDVQGKHYASQSEFTSKRLISLHSVDVSIFVDIKDGNSVPKLNWKLLTDSNKGNKSKGTPDINSYIVSENFKPASDNMLLGAD